MMYIRLLVEGHRVDEAVARKIAIECGFQVEWVLPRQGEGGWAEVKKFAIAYNKSCLVPILALVDFMDTGAICPPSMVQEWIPQRDSNMILRAVVPEIESWIMADQHGFAKFLSVPPNLIPSAPETDPDPKHTVVNLARTSRKKEIREGFVPKQGATAVVGSGYNPLMERFIWNSWNLSAARSRSPSLDKCLMRLEELRARLGTQKGKP